MDLNYIKLNGFKRFENATLNTSGKLIALLGANEAGKSSILEALLCLNHDRPLIPETQLTRDKDFQDEDIIIEAGFLLDQDDKGSIDYIYGGTLKNAQWFYVKKQKKGVRIFDFTDRHLKNANHDSFIDENYQAAINILKERMPHFLSFSEEERNLPSSFTFSSPRNIESKAIKSQPNKAVLNLLELAELDIHNIRHTKDAPKLKSMMNKANKKLEKVYQGKWNQSDIKPTISINNLTLSFFVENEEGDAFSVTQRSDGLRQFIALINFLELKHEHNSKPILLIDEAEVHLHYDAQAELIDIFTKQRFASKIIYTTHSVGCLPEDLGTGVKLVSPLEGTERSEIKNHFWSGDNRPGVLPLLFGMGASQLSFMAIRECVFVEGATDMLLLPTLFRQATQNNYLGFQIVQGIAMTATANFGLLPNHAPKVAFLVDDDQAGRIYIKQLKKSGIEESKIFNLPQKDTVLEDYIRPELYLQAVNEQIKTWHKGDQPLNLLSLEDIPEKNRPQSVKNWCKEHGLDEPEKRNIVYNLLDLATGMTQAQLIEENFKDDFKTLYERIIKSLGISLT